MSLNVALLRSSFELVLEREPNLTRRFYGHLFERWPQSRMLFGRHSQARQEQMLAEALVAVMDHLDDSPWLVEKLGALGQKHDGYGVTREMYGWVGDALLTTLAEVAGADWTPPLAQAWTDAFTAITALMTSHLPTKAAA
jgi:hemoglobin-like flavoprotein